MKCSISLQMIDLIDRDRPQYFFRFILKLSVRASQWKILVNNLTAIVPKVFVAASRYSAKLC